MAVLGNDRGGRGNTFQSLGWSSRSPTANMADFSRGLEIAFQRRGRNVQRVGDIVETAVGVVSRGTHEGDTSHFKVQQIANRGSIFSAVQTVRGPKDPDQRWHHDRLLLQSMSCTASRSRHDPAAAHPPAAWCPPEAGDRLSPRRSGLAEIRSRSSSSNRRPAAAVVPAWHPTQERRRKAIPACAESRLSLLADPPRVKWEAR